MSEADADLKQILRWIWDFSLFNVEGQSITIGSLITACVLLALAYWLAKRLTKQIERRLISRLDVDESLKYTLSRVLFYFLLVIFVLFVMHLMNIPVTIFTVMGGAVAIGIGFGSQNVMNNFISGLILMVERPVRVGDYIEVDGHAGVIESIGARSTRIRSVRNTQLILPNSKFLEEGVLNYTLDDNYVRGMVSVGVAYGSDTALVARLLRQAMEEQEGILRGGQHGLEVTFDNFGESSLDFTAYFWVAAKTMFDVRLVESAVRFRLNDLLAQHKISIPFPHRELLFNSSQALRVELAGRS